AHAQHGGVVARDRGVARLGAGDDAHARPAFLAGLDAEEALAADLDGPAAALIDRHLGVDQLAVVLPHPAGPGAAAGFLIGEDAHDQVAVELRALASQRQRDHQLGGHQILGVDRAAAPDHAVVDLAGEGRVLPLVFLDRDDV